MHKLIFTATAAFFLFSCANENNTVKNDSVKTDSLKLVTTVSEWHSLVYSWTESLNLKNASIMKSFYADTVDYYANKISGAKVVEQQQAYFTANADYHQKLAEYISEEQQPDGTWRVRIIKQVTAGGKTADYPSSLVFASKNGIWKIISESDDITDLKKRTQLTFYYEPEKVTLEGMLEGYTKNGKPAASENDAEYLALHLSQPIDVTAQVKDEINVNEKGVTLIQLNGEEKQFKSLLNKKVKVTGALFHSHTSYHYLKMLMNVSAVAAAN